MTSLADMIDELKKYGALRRQFQETGSWELRKALVLQEAVFVLKAVEFEEAHKDLLLCQPQFKDIK